MRKKRNEKRKEKGTSGRCPMTRNEPDPQARNPARLEWYRRKKKKERAVHRSLRSYRMNNRENGIGRLHGRGQIMPKDELI
jgi:hypothetical protein